MITTEKVGTRVYVTGNTFSVKDQLKDAGCHWDGERKQWWIGAVKAESISKIVSEIATAPPVKEDLSTLRLQGQVIYKSRKYYVIGGNADRCRLTVLDASIDFWADRSDCEFVKTYQPREVYGRTVYTTLQSIRSYISQMKRVESGEVEGCAECGRPGQLVRDMEDGLYKHRHCCDMEPT